MLLIRGEKRCLAQTQSLAAHRAGAVLSNDTFINVFMFFTPPGHAGGYGHGRERSMYSGTPLEMYIHRVCSFPHIRVETTLIVVVH